MMGRIIATVVALSTFACLHAEKRSTDRLAEQADAIVVAEVASGQQTGHAVSLVLTADRVVKGVLPAGSQFAISWYCPLAGNKDLKGNYGIWFLKALGTGQWTILSPIQGQYPFEFAYFPSRRGILVSGLAAASNASTVYDLTAVELVAAIQNYTGRGQLYPLASGLLSIGESTAAASLYQQLHASADPEIRFVGLAGLLRAKDPAALREIAGGMDLLPGIETRALVAAVIETCRDTDPTSISYLGQLTLSPDSRIRSGAADALKNIHTRETLPFLARLLDSDDPLTREAAITGLSRFVDNLPVQSQLNVLNFKALQSQGPTPYRTADTDRYSLSRRPLGQANEAEYLQFWKSWWVRMKDKLAIKP